jgi:hypothetical protein
MDAYIDTYIHTDMHTDIHTDMHACIHAYRHTCKDTRIKILPAHLHKFIPAYLHTYIHAYTHTHTHVCVCVCVLEGALEPTHPRVFVCVYHQPQLVAAAKDNEGACPSGHESDSEGRCRAVDGAEGVVSLDPYALEEYVLKHQVSVCVCVRACVCAF